MPIDQAELGRRLKQAREACGLSQEDSALAMGMVRATIAQIELGKRSVSGLELSRFAYLYARDVREFLAPGFSTEGLVAALFRSEEESGDGVKAALRDSIALGHQLRDLEGLLGISRSTGNVASYFSATLGSKWDAIQSGTQVANEERRRLGLGSAPLADLPTILEAQGIRTGLISMPSGISGLMIADPFIGLFVVVNRDHPPVRQRFSWCHEYAHLMLDRVQTGHISRESERGELREVRANVFAAAFLMPEDGMRQFVVNSGKGSTSRLHAEVFDEAGVVPVDSRTDGGSQDLQIYDVVKLAHHFGVSVQSALYRLLNLKLITDKQCQEMKQMDTDGVSRAVEDLLGLAEIPADANVTAFYRRYLVLALEALRREKISHRKLVEIGGKLGVQASEIEQILAKLGLNEEPSEVLLPAR
jgi:Zn-dependent peptidase ImmA (M78 family)/transcriptional regulator with XRE-family HTH domain